MFRFTRSWFVRRSGRWLALRFFFSLIYSPRYVYALASPACLHPPFLHAIAIDTCTAYAGGEGEHAVHPRGVCDGHGSPGEAGFQPSVRWGRGLPRRFPGSKQVSCVPDVL